MGSNGDDPHKDFKPCPHTGCVLGKGHTGGHVNGEGKPV